MTVDLTQKLVLSVAEANALTGIGLHAIREAIHSGALRAMKPGKQKYLINREDLDRWRLDGMPEARPEPAQLVQISSRRR